ncbi:MAG TPA: plasmid pRiA4b ORF-3 family protein [Paludibacteraceae bacterium]|nr:plasmid pRiA4b ORF-3 family protein [Paludibacteraceae bacterium]HOU69240.1 plasmid pRiA4b ORF-3 family protein [Paludibacteraceae bacterium]HQJ90598.1 plasmid pRiA4b ORF-3 family protein [Paludibacteraceae bacterium]
MAYIIRVILEGVNNPAVWREIIIPYHYSFLQLHEAIQATFGWTNSHLFEFIIDNYRIAIKSDDDENFKIKTFDAKRKMIRTVFQKSLKIEYTYDFGDNWNHCIEITGYIQKELFLAVCTAGEGTCPPENIAGIHGYKTMKNLFANDPKNEDTESYREWLGLNEDEQWDANQFDLVETAIRMNTNTETG